MDKLNLASFFFFLLFSLLALSDGGAIGVNYGRVANNLPSASKVTALLKSHGIDRVKIYDADPAVIRSLAGSGIKLTIALPNEQLRPAATRATYAAVWVRRNVAAYFPATQIEAIAVGNEVFVDPGNTTKYLVTAMENVHSALLRFNLADKIKVSSPIALSALGNSYPSSAGSFRPELIKPVFDPILSFLRKTGSYLMVNAYPIFAYEANSDVISLDYALFKENPGVVDSGNGFRYMNLFDAQIDAVFAALSSLKYDDIDIVVSETGWPSNGDSTEIGASLDNAAAYNGNLVRRILTGGGTPTRPKAELTVFLFALFNENKKPGFGSERNYGLFYPNETKVYEVPLTMAEVRGEKLPAARRSGKVAVTREGMTWCVANGEVGEDRLQKGLDYACGEGGADCRPIQEGATCYDPNTMEAHASYAFNSYYQRNRRTMGSCDFQGAAYVISHPPRFGECEFPTGEGY